jgi:hypothetical protein
MDHLENITKRLRAICWRDVVKKFGIPRFHRFEVVAMRVLFAYVLFQCMPLGAPFSSAGVSFLEPVVSEEAMNRFIGDTKKNEILRPPLPPISALLPSSTAKIPFDTQDKADGIAQFVDLTFFNDDDFVKKLPWIVFPCLLLYACGVGWPVVLPILCFVLIGSRTLYNSQGYIHHGFQMVSLVLLAQTVVALWAVVKNPKQAMGLARATGMTKNGRTWWDVMVRYSQLMIIASYMIPGVIKQFKSGGEWFLNSHYIGVQVVKTHRQNYYNDLDSSWAKEELPEMANFMLEHKNWTRLLLGCGVGLQLIAFLALYNRLTLLIFGLTFVAFHVINDRMFGLFFYHVEKMDWIFLVNIPFWIWWLVRCAKSNRADLELADEKQVVAG